MPQISPGEVNGIRKMWSFYIKWPKFMYPLFAFLEKDSRSRLVILKLLKEIEYLLKYIFRNKDKVTKRSLRLIKEAQNREFPGNSNHD